MDFNKEYDERFGWRKLDNISRLQELAEIAQTGGTECIEMLPGISIATFPEDTRRALENSILRLWLEAAECYIYGEFQACVVLCRAITERCLALEYLKHYGSLDSKTQKWTLGQWINSCKVFVSEHVINLAKQIKDLGNDRAHANLEHNNPESALRGYTAQRSTARGLGSNYLISYYYGEARTSMKNTWQLLYSLYGSTS